MKVFVTGASGYVGTHLLPLLCEQGHEVSALVRSDTSADLVSRHGAMPVRGNLTDLEILKKAASNADATIHLAYDHSFFHLKTPDMATPVQWDIDAINALGAVSGDKAFIVASGTLAGAGRELDESVMPDQLSQGRSNPRIQSELAVSSWGERGVKSVIVRLSPTVHGGNAKDWSFMRAVVDGDRKAGYAAIVGDGSNVWPAVNVQDAAQLFVLALEHAANSSPGTQIYHAVAEVNSIKTYADIIARKLDVPVKSVTSEEIMPTHGFIGMLLAVNNPTSAEITRKTLGWTPKGSTIVQELEEGSPAFFGA